jgi:hypothetical protein
MTAQELIAWLIESEAVIDDLTRKHREYLVNAQSDEERRQIVHRIGRAWGRALDETCGEQDGLALAAVLLDGVLERWSGTP